MISVTYNTVSFKIYRSNYTFSSGTVLSACLGGLFFDFNAALIFLNPPKYSHVQANTTAKLKTQNIQVMPKSSHTLE
jgi:hypothetical protein